MQKHYFFALVLLLSPSVASAADTPVYIEAESATLGSSLTSTTMAGASCITVSTAISGSSPSSDNYVATRTLTLSAGATYELYARLYVGSGGSSSDSFFHGAGFNSGTVGTNWTWITINSIAANVGFSTAGATVVAGSGDTTQEAWKWVKISGYDTSTVNFTVPTWTSSRTFKFAGREAGLYIDKFAFVPIGMKMTVAQLDAGATGTIETVAADVPTGPEFACGKSKFFGSCYSETASQNINFNAYFDQIIPGNGGKWGWVEATRDHMVWTDCDAAYNYAMAHGYPFNFHVLVWGSQQPTWMNALSTTEQLEEIDEWFAAVAARYPNIDILQVVNEPLNQPPNSNSGGGGYLAALGGAGTTGYDWIIKAFELARKHFPNTKLMINEYNVVSDSTKITNYLNIINLLKARTYEGKPLIDAIGIQCHGFSFQYTNVTDVTARLKLLTDTGLPVYPTEMDINGMTDEYQLAEYQKYFPLFWENPGVHGVTLWGYRVGMWRTDNGAFLVDWNGKERPALKWLREYIQGYEDWMGYDVETNWADTGDWLGQVYVGFNPWIYVADSDSWVYVNSQEAGDGAWAYVAFTERTVHDFTETQGTWLGYTVTSDWVDAGLWLGHVYVGYSPWIWSDNFGWMYIFKDTASNDGGWFWLQK